MESQEVSRRRSLAMATFYVFPSRHLLGRHFAEVLGTLFPGLSWPSSAWPDLAEALGTATLSHLGVYVVYREELPDDSGVEEALASACGAEQGDDVIEVHPGSRLTDASVRRWRIEGLGKAAA
jgi:hypothetical protein